MVSVREIVITFLILAGAVLWFGLDNRIDVAVQNSLYNSSLHRWILVRGEYPWIDFILYDGLKKGMILAYAVILLILLFARKRSWVQKYQKELLLVLLAGIIVPAIVGGLKGLTNVPCPRDWAAYGGTYPSVGVLDPYPADFCQNHKMRCWPAAHASFGFALLAFSVFFRSRRGKVLALAGALTVAWSMGIYKMVIGDHFLSHTVISMILGWLIVIILSRLLRVPFWRKELT